MAEGDSVLEMPRLAVTIDSPDPEVVALAMDYWSHEWDDETGFIWKRPSRDVSSAHGIPASRISAHLAGQVTARVRGICCGSCGTDLEAQSRTSAQMLVKGPSYDPVCAVCKEARTAKQREQQAEARAAILRDDEVRARVVLDTHPVIDTHHDVVRDRLDALSAEDLIFTAAILRTPASQGVFTASEAVYAFRWLDLRGRLGRLWAAGIIAPHPSSPAKAFEWDKEDPYSLPSGARYYPSRVAWCLAGSGSLVDRKSRIAQRVDELIAMGPTSNSREAVLQIARGVIEAETCRYFFASTDDHQLGDPSEAQVARLRDVVHSNPDRSIGQFYAATWGAIKDAAAAKQRNAGMSKANAISHGINQLDNRFASATQLGWTIKPFQPRRDLPLSDITYLLFRDYLGKNPMLTSLNDLSELLPAPPPAEDSQDVGELEELGEADSSLLVALRVKAMLLRVDEQERAGATSDVNGPVAQVLRRFTACFEAMIPVHGPSEALLIARNGLFYLRDVFGDPAVQEAQTVIDRDVLAGPSAPQDQQPAERTSAEAVVASHDATVVHVLP